MIAATVRNALTQGCERVLLVDNDSPDDTVAAATDAGAELAASFSTPQLDEMLKIRLLNETVANVSAASGHDHIWWLWLDADEFVHGPGGSTVRELVSSLDRRFRIVGTRYFNHYPDRRPEYLAWLASRSTSSRWCEERNGERLRPRTPQAQPPAMGSQRPADHVRARVPRRPLRGHAVRTDDSPRSRTTSRTVWRRSHGAGSTRSAVGTPAGGHAVALYDRQVRRNAGTDSDMSKRYRTLSRVYAARLGERREPPAQRHHHRCRAAFVDERRRARVTRRWRAGTRPPSSTRPSSAGAAPRARRHDAASRRADVGRPAELRRDRRHAVRFDVAVQVPAGASRRLHAAQGDPLLRPQVGPRPVVVPDSLRGSRRADRGRRGHSELPGRAGGPRPHGEHDP